MYENQKMIAAVLAMLCMSGMASVMTSSAVDYDPCDQVHFDIGNYYNFTASETGTIPIHLTGIPGIIGENKETNTTSSLYTHFGSVYGSNNTSILYYAIDTSAGQSGAPVYTITRERYNSQEYFTYTVLSIHTGGTTVRNHGPLMSKHHLMFYGSNPNTSY